MLFRSQNLQPHLTRSPLFQQTDSIQIEDALGRVKHLPYEFFRHWPVRPLPTQWSNPTSMYSAYTLKMLVTYLQMEFRGLLGEHLVNDGQYYIMDARSSGRSITASEWERYVFPGAHVIMSMIVNRFLRGKGLCSRPNCTRRDSLEEKMSSVYQWLATRCSNPFISRVPDSMLQSRLWNQILPTPI